MVEQNHKRVLRWFSVRMTDEILDKDIDVWRPELREAFDQLVENQTLKRLERGYALTHIARSQINKYKAGGWK